MSSSKYYSWIKRLGQWHMSRLGESRTICGMPMLGNNYVNEISCDARTVCKECHDKMHEESGVPKENKDG